MANGFLLSVPSFKRLIFEECRMIRMTEITVSIKANSNPYSGNGKAAKLQVNSWKSKSVTAMRRNNTQEIKVESKETMIEVSEINLVFLARKI